MDVDTTSQKLQASNILDNVYPASIIIEELSSVKMQSAVGNNYGKLHSDFNNFQNIKKMLPTKNKYLLDPKDKLL